MVKDKKLYMARGGGKKDYLVQVRTQHLGEERHGNGREPNKAIALLLVPQNDA